MQIALSEITDPRPDLLEDTQLWPELLKICAVGYGLNSELYGTLKGFRCCGLRIVIGHSGGYVLRPEVDPEGKLGFKPGEYEEMKEKWLKPYVNEITKMLQVLRYRSNQAS